MGLKKCYRIGSRSDFDQFRLTSVRKKTTGFFCKLKKNPTNISPRLALIVGKKIGKAHERNYIKRLFREIFRRERERLDPKWDYLVVVQRGIVPNFYDLKKKFLTMCALFPKSFLCIAIDGTAASGKSSTAQALAQKYHLLNVNTGNHYRALTLSFLQRGLKNTDEKSIGEVVGELVFDTRINGVEEQLTINGAVFQPNDLRSEIVNKNVALFAQLPIVRQKLRAYQRSLLPRAKQFDFAGIVMEGRDIGTHVLPQADVKIFLNADPDVRENRRRDAGEKDIIAQRDQLDGPYKNNAFTIDTTHCAREQVLALIEEKIVNQTPFRKS
ncbi:MAG: ribonuclease P protein component [Puniceicoccales bacterium]|jgi:cytidylate kinase|nr:ribonuclease P protein component [Puniceicoccales bacterium]